ncbi:MAG: FAD-dependent oxidoreductase [Candidatus Liptonbacteria bacterium]|nr:FAD-dependent oxidoreductase [Candidatus Liptonbacteria bacterium]
MYDLIIVGGGPGGVAAGVYAERKKIKTLLITDSFGGQSLVSADVRNWIGTKSVSGYDLGKMLEDHLRDHADIDIVADDVVEKVEKMDGARLPDGRGFRLTTKSGKTFETKYILVASGSRRRKLGIPGEKEFDGKGVVYCSTCDAPVFKDKTVAVVGGGNAGLEAVVDLFPYALKIYLIVRSDSLKGDPVTQDKVKNSAKVQVIYNALTREVLGDQLVTGLAYKDAKRGDSKELKVDGVFVEIGLLPNSEVMNGLVELNGAGEIVVDHKTQQTSDPGIWAAGDVSDVLYKQNNISAGDAVKAVLNIYDKLQKE